MAVKLAAVVEEIFAPETPQPAAPPKPDPKPVDEQMIAVIQALSAVLAVRVIMALAVVGAFVLAVFCVIDPKPAAIAVFGIYTVSVLGPLVWLAQRRT